MIKFFLCVAHIKYYMYCWGKWWGRKQNIVKSYLFMDILSQVLEEKDEIRKELSNFQSRDKRK